MTLPASVGKAVAAAGLGLAVMITSASPALADPDHPRDDLNLTLGEFLDLEGESRSENNSYDPTIGIPVPKVGTIGVPQTYIGVSTRGNGRYINAIYASWETAAWRNDMCNTQLLIEAVDAYTGKVYFSAPGEMEPGCTHDRTRGIQIEDEFRLGEIRVTLLENSRRTQYTVGVAVY